MDKAKKVGVNPLQIVSTGFRKAGAVCQIVARSLYQDTQAKRVVPWFRDNGDATHRLNYALDADSLVFDLGGYEGQWASDIFAKYGCTVYVFEAVEAYADRIRERFAKNPRIEVFPFGLSDSEKTLHISIEGDTSSTYKSKGTMTEAKLLPADAFLRKRQIRAIDLLKMNIEGGEYDLLEHLLTTGWIERIGNLQVQFHDFVPDAENRMRRIQAALEKTHFLTYQYPFVWENWQRKSEPVAIVAAESVPTSQRL